ncbi:hypothetical protein PVBG_05423 [Plasmodium vivax Brazil I]|uniref:Variable surface protein n=1 Tax=Plasmodium vivax (strain Brazil I) TaxID=1033975 RepID=A0A0J9SZB4_PLAV1|nr:hypothetical protein PVBG_05423 [Plasmodium vivax Brazil I]
MKYSIIFQNIHPYIHTYICYFFRFFIIQNLFEYRCGTDVFKRFYKEWDPDFKNYLNHINEINDPILRHISMYFVQHYIDGHHYYRESDPTHRNAACQYIIHWLQEKKDLFTYGEKCKTKKELWKTNFDALLTMLKSKYIIKEYKITKPWCNDFELVELTSFDPGVTLNNCEENISQVSSSPCPSTLPNITNCECPQTVDPMIPSQQDQPPETDRTKNLAVTSGFTAAGTLGTLFFLYRVINKQ